MIVAAENPFVLEIAVADVSSHPFDLEFLLALVALLQASCVV